MAEDTPTSVRKSFKFSPFFRLFLLFYITLIIYLILELTEPGVDSFIVSPVITFVVGGIGWLAVDAFYLQKYMPAPPLQWQDERQCTSADFAGTPFAKGWGKGWGNFRHRLSNRLFLTAICFFTPIMFMDATIFEVKTFKKLPPLDTESEQPLQKLISTTFANTTCSTENQAHRINSVPIALSNGELNSTDVTFRSCECECLSSPECDRFVYEPEMVDGGGGNNNRSRTGYCQLRRPLAGLSLWEAMKSLNSPLKEDVRNAAGACVWVHNDAVGTQISPMMVDDDYGGSGVNGNGMSGAATNEVRDDANTSLWQYIGQYIPLDLRHKLQGLLFAVHPDGAARVTSAITGQRCNRKEGILLKDVDETPKVTPNDVFLRSVCDALASSKVEDKNTKCYGRARNPKDPSEYPDMALDCRNLAHQKIIVNELDYVDCWQWRPVDAMLATTHLTIGFVVANYFMQIFNLLDPIFGIGKPGPGIMRNSLTAPCRTACPDVTICSNKVFFFYLWKLALVVYLVRQWYIMMKTQFEWCSSVERRTAAVNVAYALSTYLSGDTLLEYVYSSGVTKDRQTRRFEIFECLFKNYGSTRVRLHESPVDSNWCAEKDHKDDNCCSFKDDDEDKMQKGDGTSPGDWRIFIGKQKCGIIHNRSVEVAGRWTAESTLKLIDHVVQYPDDRYFTVETTKDIVNLSGVELWHKFHDILKDEERDPKNSGKASGTKPLSNEQWRAKRETELEKNEKLKDSDRNEKLKEINHLFLRRIINWQILRFVAAIRNVPPQIRSQTKQVEVSGKPPKWETTKEFHLSLSFEDAWNATWDIVQDRKVETYANKFGSVGWWEVKGFSNKEEDKQWMEDRFGSSEFQKFQKRDTNNDGQLDGCGGKSVIGAFMKGTGVADLDQNGIIDETEYERQESAFAYSQSQSDSASAKVSGFGFDEGSDNDAGTPADVGSESDNDMDF